MNPRVAAVCRRAVEAVGDTAPDALALLEAADAAAGEGHTHDADEWLSFVGHAADELERIDAPKLARALRNEERRSRRLLETVVDKPSAEVVATRRRNAERQAQVASMHRAGASAARIASVTGASPAEIERIGGQVMAGSSQLSEAPEDVAQRQRVLRAHGAGVGVDAIARCERLQPGAVVRVVEEARRAALPGPQRLRLPAGSRALADALWPSAGASSEGSSGLDAAGGRLLEAVEERRAASKVQPGLADGLRARGLSERTMRSLGYAPLADADAVSGESGQAAWERAHLGGDPDRGLVETPAERAASRAAEPAWRERLRAHGVPDATLDRMGGPARGAA